MQRKILRSNWLFIANFFDRTGRKAAMSMLMMFMLGLISNSASGQGLPLQNFNSGMPSAWTVTSTDVAKNWGVTTPTGGNLSTPGMVVDPTSNMQAQYFLITPEFTTPAVTEIRFFTKLGSPFDQGGTYKLMVSTAPQPNINNFVEVKSWTETTLNVKPTTYEEKVVTLPTIPAGTKVFLAFVASGDQEGYGSSWFVDDVRVINSCSSVTGITSSMTANGGLITWENSSASKFQIQLVPKGQGIAQDGTPVDGFQYTASGLNDGTEYDVYLKSFCDATTATKWAGPFPVKTARLGLSCATPVVIPSNISVNPYVLSSNLNAFYDNQTYVPLDSNVLCQPAGADMNFLAGEHAFLSYTPTVSGLVNVDLTVNTDKTSCFNTYSSVFIFDTCSNITAANCKGAIMTGQPSSVTSAQLSNVYLVAGTTYYFVISSPYQHTASASGAAGLCFTFTLSQPSCPVPSGMSYKNLAQTSAAFSWDNPQSLASQWQFVVKPAADAAPSISDVGIPTNSNVNNIPPDAFTPNTAYKLYVRSVCGSELGSWSDPFPFKTLCTVFPTPYSTQFSGSSSPSGANPAIPEPCWTSFDLNHDNMGFTYSTDFSPGAPQGQTVRLYTMISGSQTNDMLASPQVHFDGVTQKRLRFKFKGLGGYTNSTGYVLGESSFSIKISTTGVGPDNFTTELEPVKTYETGNNWIEKVIPLPEGLKGDVSFAWVLPPGYPNTATNFNLDDVYIEDLPPCSEPSYPGVTAGSITTNSAQFYWTNGYKNTQWEIAVQPLGSGVPVGSGEVVSTNPFNKIDLKPSTRYEYYIRTHCNEFLQSEWIGPVKFNTVCDTQPVPYYESLNDTDVTTKKFCWSVTNKDDDATRWSIDATQATIRPQDQFQKPFVTYDDYLISAQVNVTGQKMLKFKYKVTPYIFSGGERGNLEVLMSSTPDFSNPKVLIPSHDFTNQEFVEDYVVFDGIGPAFFALRVPPTMNDPRNSGVITIDDFSIDEIISCPAPSLLSVSNILTNSADLSWKPGFNETKWEIVIQSPLSGVPTGSGTEVKTNAGFNSTGLSENTTYEYYVRAVCDSNFSKWVGPFQFRTICSALPTPFIETFEAGSATESCWTTVNNNKDLTEWSLSMTVKPIFGDQMAALNCFKNGHNEDWLISPTLTVKPNQRLRFYYKSEFDPFYQEDLKVQISTEGVDISKFTTVLYENNISTTTDATGIVAGSDKITVVSVAGAKVGDFIDIPGYLYPGNTVIGINGSTVTLSAAAPGTAKGPLPVIFTHENINNIAAKEMVINLTGIIAPTNINIAFHVPTLPPDPSGLRGSFLNIDNVIIEDIPVCPSVYNVATNVQTISDTSAVINWETKGSETSWQISVQPFGTPAPVGNTLPEYLKIATAHPYTITGLTPSTKYQYYVRSVCSGTSQNEWVGPFELLTKCDLSNVCEYTVSLTNGTTGQVYAPIDIVQNGVVQQTLTFPTFMLNQPPAFTDYQVFLCSGVEFNLYWRGGGSGQQYAKAQVVVKDQLGNVVYTSPLGIGKINTTIYTGVSNCKVVTCIQPTNLAVNNLGELSWTPGGQEKQWEVFVQPLGQGSIPQSGVIVDTPTYTPKASDFVLAPTAGTNEFFVRAVCGENDKSYWTGPKVFIRNDEPTTAIALQVNTNGACTAQGTKASFIGATASDAPTSCGGVNGGDIWYEFVATSRVSTVELSNFNPGSYYASGYEGAFPTIMLSLYEVQADGSLVEKACSENNSIVASYSSELTVGKTYKIRVKYNDTVITDKKFDICVSTPAEICDMDAFNYSFEKLPMKAFGGTDAYIFSKVVPGWRTNTDAGIMFFFSGTNSEGAAPYEGGQFIQLISDPISAWNPNGPIKGLYKDMETPAEVLKMNYSFASATRGSTSTLELWAGPPSGPFTKVDEHTASTYVWGFVTGTYVVPAGQPITRFIFRVKGNLGHHLLDAANFKAETGILSKEPILPCANTSATVEAEGTGEWIIGENNPAATTIESPTSKTTAISGISTSGEYTYYWKTRYCEKPFKVTYQGFTDVATVTTPVEYCISDTPSALTATASAGYTLLWYTAPVGGTGDVNAPTPSTATVGKTTYYVALVDVGGCEGPRTAVDVIVKDLVAPVVGFNYDQTEYCLDGLDPVITTNKDFATGGTFSATPAGLAINAATGAIDLSASTQGVDYKITYTVQQKNCFSEGSQSVNLMVADPCGSIQKGISPNGDGSNDEFDLTALHIKKINIFNRYGTEVYSHGEGYTNQWKGQMNNGDKLPDGTYFYTLVKEDDVRLTGWIYIIK